MICTQIKRDTGVLMPKNHSKGVVLLVILVSGLVSSFAFISYNGLMLLLRLLVKS